jgi:O-antigen ligase
MVEARPFFGFGWDRAYNNTEPYFRLDPDIPLSGAGAGLHNVYLNYTASLGIVGMALWTLGVALAFGRAMVGRAPPRVVPWKLGMTAVFIAWFVVGLFSPGHYPFTAYLVWAWAGVAYRSPVRLRAVEPAPYAGNGRPVATARVRPSVT